MTNANLAMSILMAIHNSYLEVVRDSACLFMRGCVCVLGGLFVVVLFICSVCVSNVQ